MACYTSCFGQCLGLAFVIGRGQNAGQSFSGRASNSRIMSYRKHCVCVAKNKWVTLVYFDNYSHITSTPCGENAE